MVSGIYTSSSTYAVSLLHFFNHWHVNPNFLDSNMLLWFCFFSHRASHRVSFGSPIGALPIFSYPSSNALGHQSFQIEGKKGMLL